MVKKKINKYARFWGITSSIVMVVAVVAIAVYCATLQLLKGNNVINVLNSQNLNASVEISEQNYNSDIINDISNKKINAMTFATKFNYNKGDKKEALNNLQPIKLLNKNVSIFYKITLTNNEESAVTYKIFFKGISKKKLEISLGSSEKDLNIVDDFENAGQYVLQKNTSKNIFLKLNAKTKNGKNLVKTVNFFNISIEIKK